MKEFISRKQDLLKAFAIIAVILAVIAVPLAKALALEISPDGTTGYTYFTDSAVSVSVPLSEAAVNENAALFTKQGGNTYDLDSFNPLSPGSTSLSISGSWTAYEPETYYIALTDYTQAEAGNFSGRTPVEQGEDTVVLENDSGDRLTLQIIRVVYDTDIPVINSVGMSTSDWAQEVTLTISAADTAVEGKEVAGLHERAYSFDNGNTWQISSSRAFASNGTVNIKVRDAAGNESAATGITISNIDRTNPTVSSVSVSPDVTDITEPWEVSATITIVGAADSEAGLAPQAYSFDGGAHWQASNAYTAVSNGDYDIQVRDAAGNILDYGPVTLVKIDHGSPAISEVIVTPDVTHTTDAWVTSAKITIEGASDSGVGLADEAYSFDGGAHWQASNEYTVTSNGSCAVQVRDALGNILDCGPVSVIRVDSQSPTVEDVTVYPDITSIGGFWARYADISVIGAADSGSGLANQAYSFDGGAHWQSSNVYRANKNGNYPVYVRDAVGNIFNWGTITFYKADSTSPTITNITVTPDVTHITDAWATSATIAVIGATDSESGLAAQAYSFDGGAHWQTSNEFVATLNGDYPVQVRDAVGNVLNCETVTLVKIDEAPVITINEASISTYWSKDATAMEFSVSDAGPGYDIEDIAGSVADSTVAIAVKAGTEDTYTATITGDPDMLINSPITLIMTDSAGTPGTKTSTRSILIDNTDPTITIDESTISDSWSDSSTTFEFSVTDTGSLVPLTNISGTVGHGTVSISSKPGYPGVYIATVTADAGFVIEDTVTLTANDNVGNSGHTVSVKNVRVDLKDAEISNLTFEKISGSPDPNAIKTGDSVRVSFELEDEGSGVDDSSVQIRFNGSAVKTAIKAGSVYSGDFMAGVDFTGTEDTLLALTSIYCSDNVGNAATAVSNVTTSIKFHGNIGTGLSGLTFFSDNIEAAVAKTGDRAYVSFYTTHPVLKKDAAISQTAALSMVWVRNNDTSELPGCYYHEGYCTLVKDSAYDNKDLDFTVTLYDAAQNTEVIVTQADTGSIKYYAPIVVSSIVIVSNNNRDGSKYAKNGDAVKVTFTTNHDTIITGTTIGGKAVSALKESGAGIAKYWTMSYKLENGDVADISKVPFSLTANDVAGNPEITRTQLSSDVASSIIYYAPITAATSISSDYRNSNYINNGGSVTVYGRMNHAVAITSASIMGRRAGNSGSGSASLRMSYQIPFEEDNIDEGAVKFAYAVSDAAGNTLSVNKTNGSRPTAVTYDRTAPTISISPNLLSFTAESVTFTVTFEDEHLCGEDISILLNGEQQMTSRDKASVSGTRYSKAITLDTDGNYSIVASQYDRAGNKTVPDASASITIDMTSPEIKTVNINMDKPQAFRSGFKINDYFNFIDENIKDIICTLTDSEGTRDWDVNEALTGDGKKTINLIVIDMANNTSATVTYDLYIDGTAPKPLIIDSISGGTVAAGENPNAFLSEMELSVSLESLNIEGLTKEDQFTQLIITKKDGAIVADILNIVTPDENGMYNYSLEQFGDYVLLVEAADEVGNETGELRYEFRFQDKSIFQKFYENTPLFVSVISIVVLGAVVLTVLRLKSKNKKVTNGAII